MQDTNRLLSAMVLFVALSFVVSPVLAADLQPLTQNEMSSVSGQSNMQQIITQAREMEKLDSVFKEMKRVSSAERLQKEQPFGGMVNNPMARDVTTQVAQNALRDPATTTRIVTSGTVQEMAKIAATTASIFKGFVGNVPSGQ